MGTTAGVALALLIVLISVGVIVGALRLTRRLAGISEQSDATGEEQPAERELAESLETPQGQARLAYTQGASMFQIDLPLSETRHGTVLGAVESEGWRMEHVDYMFAQKGFASSDTFAPGEQRAADAGRIVGVYIFRRAEPPGPEEPASVEAGRPADVPAPAPAPVPRSAPILEPMMPPVSPPTAEPFRAPGYLSIRPPDSA